MLDSDRRIELGVIAAGIKQEVQKKLPEAPDFGVELCLFYDRLGRWLVSCDFRVDVSAYPHAQEPEYTHENQRVFGITTDTGMKGSETSTYKLLESCFLRSAFFKLEKDITDAIKELIAIPSEQINR